MEMNVIGSLITVN